MTIFKALIVLLPWRLRKHVLSAAFGYRFGPGSKIGLSWIFPKTMNLGKGARIGSLNVAINLEEIRMGDYSTIGRNNWITGYPLKGGDHFTHRSGRSPTLVVGEHAAITKNHHIDCTDRIEVGRYTTIAGYRSQFLTHSINIEHNVQDCHPIKIGEYSFVSTSVVVLAGATIPSRSVVAAGAVVNKALDEEFSLYGGVPAKKIKSLPSNSLYFSRSKGFVI